jgi:hypothetical protein
MMSTQQLSTFSAWCLCIWSQWMRKRPERFELHHWWSYTIGKTMSSFRRVTPLSLSWRRPRTCSWIFASPAKSDLFHPTWNSWDVVGHLLGIRILVRLWKSRLVSRSLFGLIEWLLTICF